MTTNTIDTLKARIADAQAIIDKAQPLADKLAAMQAAATSIAQAQRTLATLSDQIAEAEAAERIRAAAVARWTIISIQPADGYSAGAASRHLVTASRIAHGINGPEPSTERHVLSNLGAELRDVVLANTEKLPAYILALDADPVQALRKHAQHVGRGYMSV